MDAGVRVFDVERFHGGEGPLSAVLDAARTLPMMAPRRVVIALHAERWLQPKRESRAAAEDLAALEAYVDAPAAHASLVLVAAGLNEQRRASKRLLAAATVVRCGGVASVSDAQRWVLARLREAGKAVDPQAARALGAMVGPDVGRLRREVDRLLLYAAAQDAVDDGRRRGGRRSPRRARRLGGDPGHRARAGRRRPARGGAGPRRRGRAADAARQARLGGAVEAAPGPCAGRRRRRVPHGRRPEALGGRTPPADRAPGRGSVRRRFRRRAGRTAAIRARAGFHYAWRTPAPRRTAGPRRRGV